MPASGRLPQQYLPFIRLRFPSESRATYGAAAPKRAWIARAKAGQGCDTRCFEKNGISRVSIRSAMRLR